MPFVIQSQRYGVSMRLYIQIVEYYTFLVDKKMLEMKLEMYLVSLYQIFFIGHIYWKTLMELMEWDIQVLNDALNT